MLIIVEVGWGVPSGSFIRQFSLVLNVLSISIIKKFKHSEEILLEGKNYLPLTSLLISPLYFCLSFFQICFTRPLTQTHFHSDIFLNQNELSRQPCPTEECSEILRQILTVGSHILSQETHRAFSFQRIHARGNIFPKMEIVSFRAEAHCP